jgi:hypothetical protein
MYAMFATKDKITEKLTATVFFKKLGIRSFWIGS